MRTRSRMTPFEPMLGSRDALAASQGRLFPSDLDAVANQCDRLFQHLRGARILVTGGTGFIGRWLLETLLGADARLGLDVRVSILSRDTSAFTRRAPHLAQAVGVELLEGDIRTFPFPTRRYDHILHLAAETNTSLTNPSPETYFDVIVGGSRRLLDFAERAGTDSLLFVSSGAIYGPTARLGVPLSEDNPGGPDPTSLDSAYGEAKRCAELLTCATGAKTGFKVTIARCFAFVGPYLPLASGFAIGNFIRDALDGQPIIVRGDGRSVRTYLYAADMASWLWTIALEGSSGRAYNIGSDERVSIARLARMIGGNAKPEATVRFLGGDSPGAGGSDYTPIITRAKEELGLRVTTSLGAAIERTMMWETLRRRGCEGKQ